MKTHRNFIAVSARALFALFLSLTCNPIAHAGPAPGLSSIMPGCALPGGPVTLKGNGLGARNVKIAVAGIAARIVQATGNQVDFLVPTEAPPGMTQVAATNPGGQTGAIDFQVKQAEICANQFDDDCDGGIDEVDACPVTALTLANSPTDLTFEVDRTEVLTTTLQFTSSSTNVPFTIHLSQTVDPPTGLTLTPAIHGTVLHHTASAHSDYRQTLAATAVGTYRVTTTANVVETGQSQSVVSTIRVDPAFIPPPPPEEFSTHFEILNDNDWLPMGDAYDWHVNFGFNPKDKTKAYTVRFQQTVMPTFGLAFQPPLDGKVVDVTGGWHERLRQEFITTQEGEYDVITTATVLETGYSISVRNEVRVAAAGSPNVGVIGPVLVGPEAYPADLLTEFDAWVDINGDDASKVEGVTVEERRTARQWNFTEKPSGAYEGKIAIDTRGMVPDDCFSFRAIVHTSKGDRIGDYQDYCVTGLPLHGNGGLTMEEVEAGFTGSDGTQVAKDLIDVTFKSGVPEARMREIVAALGGTIIYANPKDRNVRIRLLPQPASLMELMTIAHRLAKEPEVRSLYLPHFIDGGLLSLQTSDPASAQQPHLKQIRVDQAWYLERGQGQTIAVLDTGVDLDHPDLSDKLRRDRDGLIIGRDFSIPGSSLDDPPPYVPPYDLNSHGTHVAGIAAAATNNDRGVAGIGWNTKILPIKVTGGSSEHFDLIPVVNALQYVRRVGDVKIVNFSAGASLRTLSFFCEESAKLGLIPFEYCSLYDPSDEEALKFLGEVDALCRAVAISVNEKDIFFVAGAGNIGHEEKHYPAACKGAVAVAAVNDRDIKADFSEYGEWIAIAAPGENIYSTYPTYPTDLFPAGSSCVTSTCDYGTKSGTSQASPMVAGAAALVLSQNPGMMPRQIRERLKQT
ncbi:MAG: S8 family serine peptidase, partial [Methylococcales bacterium]